MRRNLTLGAYQQLGTATLTVLATPKMHLDKFHCFSSLPPELRDAIWDLAASRPACRGVHYFTVTFAEPFVGHSQAASSALPYPTLTLSNSHAFAFLPPESTDGTRTSSWTSNNPSTYATYAGLLTACRDSRSALWRRHGNGISTSLTDQIHSGVGGRDPEPAFGFEGVDAEELRLTRDTFGVKKQNFNKALSAIYPFYDLIYIQGQRWHDPINLVHGMPFHEEFIDTRIFHLALDFNPLWNMGLESVESEIAGILSDEAAAFHESWLAYSDMHELLTSGRETLTARIRLWLVDPRLRRKLTVLNESHSEDFWRLHENPDGGAVVFETSRCRYHVVPRYLEHELCAYDEEDENSVLHFLPSLYATVANSVRNGQQTVSEAIGILVCEDVD